MEGLIGLFIGIGFVVGFVLVMRWLGSWMLRIDEVIKNQKETLKHLKTIETNVYIIAKPIDEKEQIERVKKEIEDRKKEME